MLKVLKNGLLYILAISLLSGSLGIVRDIEAEEDSYSISSEETTTYISEVGSSSRRTLFSVNWKFYYGEQSNAELSNFDDSSWRNVDLPHDYSLELDYTQQGEAESGYKLGGTGWYRKTFTVSAKDRDKSVFVEFGGVYMNSTVFVNGKEVGFHPNGYTPFAYDISEFLNYEGENIIAVKVDHKFPSSRWYSGSGIYRDVYMSVTDKVNVNYHGVQISSNNLEEEQNGLVNVLVNTKLNNDNETDVNVTVKQTLREKVSQNVVDTKESAEFIISAGVSVDSEVNLGVNRPTLWGLKNPFLYEVLTEILVDGEVVDTVTNDYGFRIAKFDKNDGFFLNGEPVKLRGVSMHSDQGSLGAAAHTRAMERQVEILLEMGVNAIRVTHNPADDELMEIANRKGMLIIDEAFDTWVSYKNGNIHDFASWFTKEVGESNLINSEPDITWAEYTIKTMVRRGINDPSIITWSIGNEVMEGNSGPYDNYPNIAADLTRWVEEVDDSRPSTIGDNKLKDNWQIAKDMNDKISKMGAVIGLNYASGANFDNIHREFPEWAMYAAETSSAINSRGVYKPSNYDRHLTSYDESRVGWGALSADSWHRVITRDFMAGEFVWTGFDYLGEPTPSNGIGSGSVGSWPAPKSSYFGIVDTAGLPKDRFYFYQSQWNDEVDTLHVLPAWERSMVQIDGKGDVRVDVYSNAASVELFFKGADGVPVSLGKKAYTEYTTPVGHKYQMYEGTDAKNEAFRNMYMTWQVPYADGEVYAVGYDTDGNVIENTQGRNSVKTFDSASKLSAVADRLTIDADGRDLSYITIDVEDANGLTVDDANNLINVTVRGNGELIALDNGDQLDHEPYSSGKRKAFSGKLVAIVKSTKDAGSITVNIESEGLESTSLVINTINDNTSEDAYPIAYVIPKNYYVKEGHNVELQPTAKIMLSDGSVEEHNIVWNTPVGTGESETINGVVEKYDLTVTTLVTYIEEVADLLDYSTAVQVGVENVNLPTSRPIVLSTGEVLTTEMPIKWEAQDPANYAQEGTVVIKGESVVFGEIHEILASVRVSKAEVNIGANVAPNYLTLDQSIPKDNQSDSLLAIVDGSKTVQSVGENQPNPSVWTNYAMAQLGENEAEIVFTFATGQRIGEVDLYFYQDGWSARLPESVKFMWSMEGTDDAEWYEIEHTEVIDKEVGSRPNVTKGRYNFTEVPAVGFKIILESIPGKFEGKNHYPAVGLSEVELKVVTTSLIPHSKSDLDGISLNGFAVSEEMLKSKVIETQYEKVKVEVDSNSNVAATVLNEKDGVVTIITESEDQSSRSVYKINLGSDYRAPGEEYPYTKTTATDGAHQTGAEGSGEGSAKFAVDNNYGTIFHSPWDGTDIENFWVKLELEEVTKLNSLRYMSRSGQTNGIVNEYVISCSLDDENYEEMATGNFGSELNSWSEAKFDREVDCKYVMLRALSTYGAGAQANKFMSAKEIRVVKAKEYIDISEAEVTLDETEYYYNNKEKLPIPTVTIDGEVLEKGVHYRVSYLDNIEVGTASVLVTGIERHEGSVVTNFTIKENVSYTTLVNLIADAKEIAPEEYTSLSFEALEEAILVAEDVLDIAETQLELDDGVIALQSAIDSLVVKPEVDLDELKAKLDEVENLERELYTEESLAELDALVEEIKTTIEVEIEQESINDLYDRLVTMITELKHIIDTEELESLIEDAKLLVKEDYTEESFENLVTAITNAVESLSGFETQAQVDAMVEKLQSAIEGLIVDVTDLQDAIDAAKEIELDKYTVESADRVVVATENAEEAIETNELDTIKNALDQLEDAIENLEEAPVKLDSSKLDQKIIEAKNIRQGLYTKESYDTLQSVIEEAEIMLASLNARAIVTQEDIDTMVAKLDEAIGALVKAEEPTDPKDPVDPSKPVEPGKDKDDNAGVKPPTGIANSAPVFIGLLAIGVLAIFLSIRKKDFN